jgi:hypothetical protein
MDQQPPYQHSGFSVARDPGLPFVTVGFLAMFLGLFWLYLRRFILRPIREGRAIRREGP